MNLWLSRILLRVAPRPRDVHAVLWRAFPGIERRPFLYRADEVEDGLRVLVQSSAQPSWLLLGDNLSEAVGPKHYDPPIEPGRRFRFFLRANTTVSRKGRKEPGFASLSEEEFRARRGHRVGILRDEDRVAWLLAQGERRGFRVLERDEGTRVLTVSAPFVTSWRRADRVARHDGVDFEGLLAVQDAAKLSRALAAGIGSAKAFGFGMLSLAPGS